MLKDIQGGVVQTKEFLVRIHTVQLWKGFRTATVLGVFNMYERVKVYT